MRCANQLLNALRLFAVAALLATSTSVLAQVPRARPDSFHYGSSPSFLPLSGFARAPTDRASLLASVASDVTDHLETLTFTRNYAEWLVSGGGAAMGLLEQQVANGPADVASAALLALCELKQSDKARAEFDPWTTDDFGACLRSPRAGSAPAVMRLAALVRTELEQPPLVGHYRQSQWGTPDLVFCVQGASLAAALGADARDSAGALVALLEDPRPHQISDVDTCPRRLVAAALSKILLSSPRDVATIALAERATVILVESTFTYWDSRRSAPSADLLRLLDASPSASLRRQLDSAAARWTKECKVVWSSYGAPFAGNPFAAELGRPGSYFVVELLNRLAERPAKCDREETRRQLLMLSAAYTAVHEEGPCRGLSADWAAEPLMVSPSDGDGHAHFLVRQENAWKKREAYLTLGDVVFVRPEDAEKVQRSRVSGSDSGHVCAWYQNGGPKTSGWLSTTDLDDMPTDAQWADIAPKMPGPAGWPTSARRMNYFPQQTFDESLISPGGECAPSVTSEACARLQKSGRYARYQEDSEDCGSYSVFLFNNGVRVVAEGMGCYGNHGQSDPTGFYLNVNR